MKKFVKIDGYGMLHMDKVLFEANFPIIFTCLNENNDIFLCVCCQNNIQGCKWLVGKTKADFIVAMLKDKITVRQLLLDYSDGRITVDYVNGEYKISFDNSDWDDKSIFLPKEDSYLDAEEDEFKDDIMYFSSMELIPYSETFYKNISEAVVTFAKEIEPITEMLSDFSTILGKITISREMMVPLEIFGELCQDASLEKEKYTDLGSFKSLYNNDYDTAEMMIEVKLDASKTTLVAA